MNKTKTLAIVAAIGVVAVVVYPGLLQYAPLLLVAICPLSMILMGGHAAHMGMGGHQAHQANDASGNGYTCPMHPEVSQAKPGRCPKCGMALVASTRNVQDLEARLQSLAQQQTALAAEIERAKNDQSSGPPSNAVREAQEVLRAAERYLGQS